MKIRNPKVKNQVLSDEEDEYWETIKDQHNGSWSKYFHELMRKDMISSLEAKERILAELDDDRARLMREIHDMRESHERQLKISAGELIPSRRAEIHINKFIQAVNRADQLKKPRKTNGGKQVMAEENFWEYMGHAVKDLKRALPGLKGFSADDLVKRAREGTLHHITME